MPRYLHPDKRRPVLVNHNHGVWVQSIAFLKTHFTGEEAAAKFTEMFPAVIIYDKLENDSWYRFVIQRDITRRQFERYVKVHEAEGVQYHTIQFDPAKYRLEDYAEIDLGQRR